MTEPVRSRLPRITVWPRRDWRFWSSLAAFGAVLAVGVSLWSQIGTNSDLSRDNDRLQSQVDEQSAQQECRSRAAVFTEDTDIKADSLLALALVAAVRDIDLEPFTVALSIANANRDTAITARAEAIDICTTDPTHDISPSILQAVPSVPSIPATHPPTGD